MRRLYRVLVYPRRLKTGERLAVYYERRRGEDAAVPALFEIHLKLLHVEPRFRAGAINFSSEKPPLLVGAWFLYKRS